MGGMHDDVDLGHTVAGWTGCVVVLCGCATVGVAMCAASPLGIRLGLGVVALGGLLTWALHLAGWGKPRGPRPPEQWDWRVKDPMTDHGDCLACRLAGRGTERDTEPDTGTGVGTGVAREAGCGIERAAKTGAETGVGRGAASGSTPGAAPEDPAISRAPVLTDR